MTERKVKLDRANKSILLRALGDVYYGQRAHGGSTEVTGRLILRVNDLPAGCKLTLSAAEYRLAKAALNQLRTQRLAEGGYTDAVDDALTRLAARAHAAVYLVNPTMTWEKFWSIIDRVRAKADMQDEASVKQFLYTELIKLPQDELLGFDCAWQSYRNKANFPKMVAAACIINDGSSDDRFTDFRNWLIMQGYDAYRQALIDPDNLAALNIPFRDTEWMGCGNVAWYAYAGQKLRAYFEKAGIAAELHRKYPTLLKLPDDLHQAIMQEQLAPCRAPETEWERQMLRTEVKHYIEVSDLAYSYNKFYAQNMPDKVAWETLQSDLFANLPQIKAERMPQDFSAVLPKLWRKRQAWDAERTKRPPYRGEER